MAAKCVILLLGGCFSGIHTYDRGERLQSGTSAQSHRYFRPEPPAWLIDTAVRSRRGGSMYYCTGYENGLVAQAPLTPTRPVGSTRIDAYD